MDRATELELIDELLGLKAAKSAYLDEAVTTSRVDRYASATQFDQERSQIFRALPLIAAHRSELPGPGAFLCRELAGLPVLLTRDDDGAAHAFLNVCRHRGTRLVGETAGCKRRFACPYHAWSWDNRGALKGIPHGREGFPDIDKDALGLRRLACEERHGWLWVLPRPDAALDLDPHLDGLAEDFAWLDAAALAIAHTDVQERAVNWKILIEGGIEAYHFRIAHRETIGPYFQDNLSSYRTIGPHIRSVLPRATLPELAEAPRESWSVRAHANLLYSIFPTSQLLVQQDHIAWMQLEPLAADRTRIRLSTLAPAAAEGDDEEGDGAADGDEAGGTAEGMADEDRARHWRLNHDITIRTLSEDFAIGESIQSGLASGANEHLNFGRFEGALHRFNRTVDGYLPAG